MGNEFTQAPAGNPSAVVAAQKQREAGSSGSAFLRAWRERRYAKKCCRQLHALHEQVCAAEPTLQGWPLYSHVVQQYLGCGASDAAAVLRGAEESYSDWPQTRTLTFRDVAHYLAVVGLCEGPKGTTWVGSDLRPIVSRWVPAQW